MKDSYTRPLAVVTGASSGIGFELARQFAEHDFDLLIVAEDVEISSAADTLRATGGHVEAVQADLATRDGVEQVYQRIQTTGRPVDAIALNAGVGVYGPFVDTELEEELRLIGLNITSIVHLAKLVTRDMISRGKGRVLITSSVVADVPATYMAVYGASKAFDLSFAEALRNEFKDTGVTVTALQPGPTETAFFERAGMEETEVGASRKDDPADVAREGFEALMAGKDHVVAGSFMNKARDVMAQILPETMKAEQHRKQAEPGSGGRE
jgi:short-subunit dehydrogenase